MRFHDARSTRDIELSVRAGVGPFPHAEETDTLREHLQTAALARLPDFFSFVVGEAMMTLDQAPEGLTRLSVD